jgi:ABC-type glycerol-3-phosphate transport system permease component
LTSLKEKKEMFSAEFHFLPLEPTLNSYRELFEKILFITCGIAWLFLL